jgi:multidrug efflux pump subunit AcrB
MSTTPNTDARTDDGAGESLGIAGSISRAFINSPLTPLLLIAALILGFVALLLLPREEEPQISVPMVDVFIQANGLAADDAVELVAKPIEALLQRLPGVEHVYSQSFDDRIMATARFEVGVPEDDAILRVHSEIRANFDQLPIGIPEPLIIGRGVNDVAILVLSLAPRADLPRDEAERWDRANLGEVASQLMSELSKAEDVGRTYIVGDSRTEIRVEPDTAALALYGVTLEQLAEKVRNANRSELLGRVRQTGASRDLLSGQSLVGQPDLGLLLVTTRDGRPVYVKDVARVSIAPADADNRAWTLHPGEATPRPAVSLAFAKREGANAVNVAKELLQRLEIAERDFLPDALEVEVTRNYGETAQKKSDELFSHLAGASVSIFLMIVVFIGWREGVVTLIIIPATILMTFAASYLMGFTINRVSLFALIFSIGILVDDAIVVVENIARHWRLDPNGDKTKVALRGVAEVGNPTIIATLTIVFALLPMLFVSGMMGPYMSPIPTNASAAMILSFFVAVIFAPWIMLRLQRRKPGAVAAHGAEDGHGEDSRMARIYRAIARPLLASRSGAAIFLILVFVATGASVTLFGTQSVVVKLLPFDDKSEVQVIVDLQEGATLEDTERALFALSQAAAEIPEIESIQAYAGTAAPFNFNGLVRHYFVRQNPELGDLQINLADSEERDRQSHAIALDLRARLAEVDLPAGTSVKVVEVPPGPPVLATLLAEVYGPDPETRREVATGLREIFTDVDFIVDVDDSFGRPPERLRIEIDQASLDFHGVEQSAVYDTLSLLFHGTTVGYSQRGGGVRPIPISLKLSEERRQVTEALLATPLPARGPAGIGEGNVELGEVVRVSVEQGSWPVFRKNGLDLEMVTADLAGRFEAPIYGMIAVQEEIDARDWPEGMKPEVTLYGQPMDESNPILFWDGEWEVTYVTFRDMGAAFGAALIGIYFLIVGQFRSFKLPLVIMTPIPLTLIGITLGHWAMDAPFTATSMIGFISLAGIIVRNSILLVDFIRREQDNGRSLHDALLAAGGVRFLPIFLTAITAMSGAAFILVDPIFQGLGISLLFGLATSTALTLLVIPAIYWAFRGGRDTV